VEERVQWRMHRGSEGVVGPTLEKRGMWVHGQPSRQTRKKGRKNGRQLTRSHSAAQKKKNREVETQERCCVREQKGGAAMVGGRGTVWLWASPGLFWFPAIAMATRGSAKLGTHLFHPQFTASPSSRWVTRVSISGSLGCSASTEHRPFPDEIQSSCGAS
jgi:hypothetical protein